MEESVVITGGTGYLGQHLVRALSQDGYQVYGTHCRGPAGPPMPGVEWHKADLITGEGLTACIERASQAGTLAAVINCAAASVPGWCEAHAAEARTINTPTQLVSALRHCGCTPLLIHISTDQVYSGHDPPPGGWAETAAPAPINTYGKTKLAGERCIQEGWPNHVILRPSIIVGPEPYIPIDRPLFLSYILTSLKTQTPAAYFVDEWRSPTALEDIVSCCRMLVERRTSPPVHRSGPDSYVRVAVIDFPAQAASSLLAPVPSRLLNVGGPDRLSRADMARIAARVTGADSGGLVRVVSAADVRRAVPSPADISMDSSQMQRELGFRPMSFQQVTEKIWGEMCAA